MSGLTNKKALRFGQFELDAEEAELRKAGQRVKLQHQPLKVLALLAGRANHVVTREEIQKEVWGSEVYVNFEQGLNFCIKQIRVALGDDAHTPRYIETLPRRGYRFIAEVETDGEFEDEVLPEPRMPLAVTAVTAAVATSGPPPGTFVRARTVGLFALVLALLISVDAIWHIRESFTRPVPGAKVMIAVLPFDNLSGDPTQDYLSEGLTEDMITQLGRLDPQHLGVISRTSVLKYRGAKKGVAEIGRELGVQYVAEGSVRREADRVRITAQLIQVSDQTHLWADSYDRDFRDISGGQPELAPAIAHSMLLHLPGQEQARLENLQPVDPEVYQLYLRGRYFWNKRTRQSLETSVDYFRLAIKKDPGYARAYAGLADAYTVLGYYRVTPPRESYPRAKAAAIHALERDDSLAEAHTALAGVALDYDWDWEAAERSFQRALQLAPNYATAHQWYASYLSAMGRPEMAMQEALRALELDPLSPILNNTVANHLYLMHRYDEAISQFRVTLELEPNFAMAHMNLGRVYEQKGMLKQAIEEMEKAATLSPDSSVIRSSLGYTLARAGHTARAREILTGLIRLSKHRYISPHDVALIYVGLGEMDTAFEWLSKAYEAREGSMAYIKVDPRFDLVRSDPRFIELKRKMRLPV